MIIVSSASWTIRTCIAVGVKVMIIVGNSNNLENGEYVNDMALIPVQRLRLIDPATSEMYMRNRSNPILTHLVDPSFHITKIELPDRHSTPKGAQSIGE